MSAKEHWEQDVLVIEAPAPCPLPSEVVVLPCVFLPSTMCVNNFSVLLGNESLNPRLIPKGTVIAYVHKSEVVTELKKGEESYMPIDPTLFNIRDSPIPSGWKEIC